MTVSKYFDHVGQTNEQDLMDDLVVEIIQQRGLDFKYIAREKTVESDYLFGEDPENSFAAGRTVEMMTGSVQGFDGEGDFMAGFGLDIRDEANFTISKTRFEQEITGKEPHIIRPREGDLIIFTIAKAIFEITFVEHEQPFYQIGVGHVFTLSAKRFEWSHEVFVEGDDEITDQIPNFVDPDDSEDIQDEYKTFGDYNEKDPFSENNY